jgi:hypothetical protein
LNNHFLIRRLRDNDLWKFINALRDNDLWEFIQNISRQWFVTILIKIKSSSHLIIHIFLYNFRLLMNVIFAYTQWVKNFFLICKKNFKKCNLRLSIVFEKVEMMKNRSQLMFCVKMSQTTIQKQNCDKITWCDQNNCVLSEIISTRTSTYIENRLF